MTIQRTPSSGLASRRFLRNLAVLAIVCVLSIQRIANASVLFVDSGSRGVFDGASWCTAFTDLAIALDHSNPGDTILIAGGTYTAPAEGYLVPPGLEIYGGYAGCQAPDPSERDTERYETVLVAQPNGALVLRGFYLGSDSPSGDLWDGLVFSDSPDYGVFLGGTVKLTIRNCRVENNLGTGIFSIAANGEISIEETVISNNEYGGVVAHFYSGGQLFIDKCTFLENEASATRSGGLTTVNCDVVITKSLFESNLSSDYGGGAVSLGVHDQVGHRIEACEFRNNTANNYNDGGAIHNNGHWWTNVEIKDCVFAQNQAFRGGAVKLGCGKIVECKFKDNAAVHGGAAAGDLVDFEDCQFKNNLAGNGGAVMLQAGGAFNQCTFAGNQATQGGAFFGHADFIVNSQFTSNSAIANGGALHVSEGFESLQILNSIFDHNSATSGAGIFASSVNTNAPLDSIEIINCALIGNSAIEYGGGLFAYGQVVGLIGNSILWGNHVDDIESSIEMAQLHVARAHTFNVWNSCIEGLDEFAGNSNIGDDPGFFDPDAGDYQLTWNSPCIDSGNNRLVQADYLDLDGDGDEEESVPTDIFGRPRFHQEPERDRTIAPTPVVDIGPIEAQGQIRIQRGVQ